MLQALNAQMGVEAETPEGVVSENLAEGMDSEELAIIGKEVVEGFDEDLSSRSEWESRNEEWFKMAAQIYEKKSFPWPDAANVKYPLLTTAINSFSARAYPALVTGPNLVRGIVIGRDQMGMAMEKANRIGKHMSYQLLYEMEDWEDGQDKLCVVVALIGNCFKKTYYDTRKKRNVSEIVLPKDLVVNYYAKSIEDAPRKTHILPYGPNDVVELKRSKYFLDVEFGQPTMDDRYGELTEIQGVHSPSRDDTTPYEFLEQHTYRDLDGDGYAEPVIITVERNSAKVARISKRYDEDDVERNDRNEVVRIESDEHFTNYLFFPDPQSGIYGFGYGSTIGPVNEAANTMLNQLIDAGTLSNLQGGFIGKGAKVKSGDLRFRPGEWKQAQISGDDLRKTIFPLPVKEPSNVLFTLFQALIGSGEKMASVTDIFTGEMPGQNTPATVVMTAVDQGTKVFNAVYKRLHRSFTKELRKLFYLNSKYLPDYVYFTPMDAQLGAQGQSSKPELVYKGDYDEEIIDVIPTADPAVAGDAQKLAKAQGLMGLVQMGAVNPQEAVHRILEAMNEPNIPALLQMPPPQPNPELELKKLELQLTHQREMLKLQIEAEKVKNTGQKDFAKSLETLQKADNLAKEGNTIGHRLHLDAVDRATAHENMMLQKEKLAQEAKQNAAGGSSGVA